ncbi:KilA-N domain-containing protein [Endozoicomonas atrinae]|uniref:KilA-N domain-containing protein n=1 Tax=Endozoicomonas atrinae TaxID=1333660 RepID=UPI0008264AEC|nr:KilA-N domain-containing protein [Endozoicomonas atrinae]
MLTKTNPVVAGVTVRIDENGFYSLNDLHKASGSELNQSPGQWLRTQKAQDIIDQYLTVQNCIVKKEGRYGGTYAVEGVAVAYATWISGKFFKEVIDVFLAYKSGQLKPATSPMDELNAVVLKERTSLAKAKVASEWMHDRKREKKKLADEAKKAIDELQQSLDLLNFVGPKLLVKK